MTQSPSVAAAHPGLTDIIFYLLTRMARCRLYHTLQVGHGFPGYGEYAAPPERCQPIHIAMMAVYRFEEDRIAEDRGQADAGTMVGSTGMLSPTGR